jgi:hypothetical protein
MQCFCKWQDAHKVSKKTVYELIDKDGTVEYSGPICLQYSNDVLLSKVIGQSIAFIIIAVNVILKLASIKLVEWVGIPTQSGQKALITKVVFFA